MSGFGSGIHNAGGPGSAAEPSMEEILASIRRILKEDETGRTGPMPPRANDDDLLVLDDSMMSGGTAADDSDARRAAAREAFIEAAGTPDSESVHFSSSPSFYTPEPPAVPVAVTGFVPATDEPELVLYSDEPEPELVLYSDEPEPELLLEAPIEPAPAPAPPAEAFFVPPPEVAVEPEPEVFVEPAPLAAAEAFVTPESQPAPLPEPESVIIMPPPEPTPAPPETTEPSPMSADTESSLLDDHLSSAISNSIGNMVRSATPERSTPVGRPGITLEEMVREALKPELKFWLETHLPEIVERVVRSEIERVVARIKV